jgi:hypothetical protein
MLSLIAIASGQPGTASSPRYLASCVHGHRCRVPAKHADQHLYLRDSGPKVNAFVQDSGGCKLREWDAKYIPNGCDRRRT